LEIPLKEGKEPKPQSIYPLSRDQQETLKEYIKTNLARGFIRESQLLVRYPILFVPKPDGTKRLYVDYRKLNNITIKNRYALLLIKELKDQLFKVTIYTKLDLPEAYY
jgi:hypothetical protein